MNITGITVVSVPVSDQERARDFYRDVLGFTVLSDTPMGPDRRWVMLGTGPGGPAITLVTWFDTMPAGSLKGLVLETSELEADVAALAAAGVSAGEIQDAPWGRFVTFDDPDGNGIVLQASTPA